jgi:hypothetical protein
VLLNHTASTPAWLKPVVQEAASTLKSSSLKCERR